MALGLFLLFISCQKEHVEINEPDKRTAITANDNIAGLILKVALKDGSHDNIIDACSEISINYPYSIRVKNEVIDINSMEGVEAVKLNYFQFRNNINIIYPVTVIYSDYSESILSNTGELRKIQNQYNSIERDADIECIDFVYPIEITLYNTTYQESDLIIIQNDKDLYEVFHDINDRIVAIKYPILLETSDGNSITINDNTELENEITKADDGCDEDDEIEFSDEDYPYDLLIATQPWKVLLYVDKFNETPLFSSYVLDFKRNNTVQIHKKTGTVNGKWELTVNEKNKLLKIEFKTDEKPIVWLNQEWEIMNASPVIIEMETESDSEGNIRKVILQASNK